SKRRPMDVLASTKPRISIVVPLYNEGGNVALLVERIFGVLSQLRDKSDAGRAGKPLTYEVILVNDGSSDSTLSEIRAEMRRRGNIVAVDLSRNFGHQLAATAGIEIATGEAVVLMD